MKLTQDTSPTEIVGAVGSPTEFKIKASKEAFKILSSGLYNNKIRAIIRELSCNAYDAHVAAGKKDEAFFINLPTRLDTQFSVRDNGIGLSHEEVLNLYTTYFATDKSESNEFVGALGLGSKSPFCYTEGFTIVSRYQGVRRTYSCFIAETGTPTVVLQTEEQTEECNGLEVSFPVDKQDCWEFENQAKYALEFFDPKPIINTEIDVLKKDYTFRCDTWGLRNEYGKPRAIQGMVQYDIGHIDTSRMDAVQQRIMEMPIDIFFPIGQLAVTASRESLSNDERTIGNILSAMSSISKDLVGQVKAKLEKCESIWQARILLFEMGNMSGLGAIVNKALADGAFDGVYTKFVFNKDFVTSVKELDYPFLQVVAFHKYWGRETAQKAVISNSKEVRELQVKDGNGDKLKVNFKIEKDALFIINDVGFGMERYIHYFLQHSGDNRTSDGRKLYDKVYYLNRFSKDIPETAVKKQGLKLIEDIGNPPYKLMSELRDKYRELAREKISSSPSTQKRKYIYFDLSARVNHVRSSIDGYTYTVAGWRDGWVEAEVPTPGTNYYVIVDSLIPQEGDFEHAEEFQQFVRAAVKCEQLELPEENEFILYGLTKSSPQLKESGWVEFTSYVFNKLAEVMDPQKEMELSLHLKPLVINTAETNNLISDSKRIKRFLEEGSPFRKFAENIHKLSKNSERISYLSTVVKKAKQLKLYEVKNFIDFNKLWPDVNKLYPLLDHVRRSYVGMNCEDSAFQYISLMDKDRKEKESKLFIVDNQEEGQNVAVN